MPASTPRDGSARAIAAAATAAGDASFVFKGLLLLLVVVVLGVIITPTPLLLSEGSFVAGDPGDVEAFEAAGSMLAASGLPSVAPILKMDGFCPSVLAMAMVGEDWDWDWDWEEVGEMGIGTSGSGARSRPILGLRASALEILPSALFWRISAAEAAEGDKGMGDSAVGDLGGAPCCKAKAKAPAGLGLPAPAPGSASAFGDICSEIARLAARPLPPPSTGSSVCGLEERRASADSGLPVGELVRRCCCCFFFPPGEGLELACFSLLALL
jgi:hypothetical protein